MTMMATTTTMMMTTTTTTTMMMMIKMMMMMMMKMMMMTTIIALKGAVPDFYNILTAPRTVSTLKWPVTESCANQVQCIEHLTRATCRLPRGTKGQLS